MLDLLGVPSWDRVVEFFTVSPFWLYLFWGMVIAIGAALLGWLFPVLRSLSSAVILTVVGMLVAYRKGELDAEQRERARQERERQREQSRPQPPAGRFQFKWPWE